MIYPVEKRAYELFHKGALALAKAERVGFRIDVKYCEDKKKELTEEIERLEKELLKTRFVRHWQHYFGHKFNINSNFQLSHILYKVRKIKPVKLTKSGMGATDDEALKGIVGQVPELEKILRMRRLRKIRDTYLDAFLREQIDGVIHPFFNLTTARSYRSSCEAPNFQNIPKRDKEAQKITRKAIYPRKGHQLLEVDYKSLEVIIAACYHKDPNMIEYLTSPQSDMHADIAKQIFFLDELDKHIPEQKKLRTAAKNGFVFPQFYGATYESCAYNLAYGWGEVPYGKWKGGVGINGICLVDWLREKGIKSFRGFEKHIEDIEQDFWYNRFPRYRRWRERMWELYQKRGWLKMKTGFCCSGVLKRNEVINRPIQGSAFHCLLWSFIRLTEISEEENWDSKLIGQIHDSILIDLNPDERDMVVKTVKRVMCEDIRKEWDWLIIPLDVEFAISPVDSSWYEQEDLRI